LKNREKTHAGARSVYEIRDTDPFGVIPSMQNWRKNLRRWTPLLYDCYTVLQVLNLFVLDDIFDNVLAGQPLLPDCSFAEDFHSKSP
jgi:hypothetical protein